MTDTEVFESNLTYFRIEKRYSNKAQCKCPAHSDAKASLTITKGNKCTLFHCHAGCTVDEILTAAGLEKKNTFYDAEPQQRVSKNQYWLEHNAIRYDYHRIDTLQYDCTKWRKPNKSFEWGTYKGNEYIRSTKENPINRHTLSVFCNGRIKALKDAIGNGTLVFYTEGEKDCLTLWNNGYVAFTFGGVHTFKDEILPYLKGGNFLVFADNDKQGITDAEQITQKLNTVGQARMIVPSEVPKGDISDYMQEHTKEELQALINATMQAEDKPQRTVKEKAVSEPVNLIDLLEKMQVAIKYETNDKGFGYLFADVFKGKHRYNSDRKEFMFYDGKRWVDDAEGMRAKNSAKELSDALLQYAVKGKFEKDKSEYLKQVMSLVNIRNRHNMLQDSKDVYYFQNADLDRDDYILNVSNGTIDLTDIEPKFTEHNADMLLSKICNANYDADATCEVWLKFLDDVMQGDKEKIRYLQKIAGLSLTGNTEQETMFILYGSTTRNGKSTFCETLMHLLGDYALTMQPQSLAIKQNLDSRQASGDIARLDGCRLCNASEPPKRMLFDTALLKSLLGRDSITARHLHQREFTFIPKFKMLMNTNYLPTITDDTVFSSGRINVISFDRHFEPHEQDKTLKQKLRSSKELSGILNWCIEGLRLYRTEGLKPPATVQTATDTYRADSDKIGNFLNECMTKCDRNSKAKDVYDIYAEWCNENGFGCENKGNFFAELKSKNIFASSGTVDGKTVKNIVKGYVISDTEFQEIAGKTEIPFD